jgi:hypothetical protein
VYFNNNYASGIIRLGGFKIVVVDVRQNREENFMNLWGLYVFLALLAIAMLAFTWYSARRNRRRQQEIATSRPSDTLETFVASFRPELQPIARAMYIQFQKFTVSGNLRLRKSDPVVKTLSMDRDDLEEALLKVANQFDCRKPTKEDGSKFRGRETAEDFVEFIHHLRAPEPHLEHPGIV